MPRPNILFIMDDQHRHDYLGAAGADFLRTPNLDRLAAAGVRFTQCTTNAPVCAPARIGLASGLQPSRLGCLDNSGRLPLGTTTYYQRLRDAGYRVGCVGKLDLRKSDGYNGRYGDRPYAYSWGFTDPEECEGKIHSGSSSTPIGPYTHYLADKGLLATFHQDYRRRAAAGWFTDCRDSLLDSADFSDAYIGRRAAEWIAHVPDDFPWHYFVSFVGPHDPFDPPTEYGDRYRDAAMPPAISDSLAGKPEWIKKRAAEFTPDQIAQTRRQYCAATELIDDQIGQILDALEKRGQLDNTYIIFSSDHGELLGDHGLYTKSAAYEASLRVPLIIAGPNIAGGRVFDALCELIDLNATICDFAQLAPQEDIDARSLQPVLDGQTDTHRQATVAALRNFRCIRTGMHKYIQNYNDCDELYDLEQDPHELHNIAAAAPAVVGDLARRLRRRLG